MGCSILGDSKYPSTGSGQVATGWSDRNSIALCATAISFKLATEDKQMNLEIPLPESWKRYI